MRNSYLKGLQSCDLFQSVDDGGLEKIADEFGEIVTKEKNEIIFSENNYSRSLVIILKGSVSVTKKSGSGKGGNILMNVLKQGDIFGMTSIFYEEDNFLTEITADERVALMFLSKENLINIFKAYPKVCESYITILSEKIHFLNKKISSFTKPEAIQKVSAFILQHSDKDGKKSVLPYSITKVAESLNTGRASVYRAFDALENDGIIKRDGRTVEILDFNALRKL
ncbi:MAG: Crp/Fnr family transcriptional regulator [Clostridiales bacterium]|nr:Crp/Fnr family transcriptional regulator [Clostridiales bacterium]